MLREAEFHEQSTSRAYYASFYAAEAALLTLGESRSKHSGVLSAFSELVVRKQGFDPAIGRSLRRLFDLRNKADYDWLETPPPDEDAVAIAQPFVDAVATWVAQRLQPS